MSDNPKFLHMIWPGENAIIDGFWKAARGRCLHSRFRRKLLESRPTYCQECQGGLETSQLLRGKSVHMILQEGEVKKPLVGPLGNLRKGKAHKRTMEAYRRTRAELSYTPTAVMSTVCVLTKGVARSGGRRNKARS